MWLPGSSRRSVPTWRASHDSAWYSNEYRLVVRLSMTGIPAPDDDPMRAGGPWLWPRWLRRRGPLRVEAGSARQKQPGGR